MKATQLHAYWLIVRHKETGRFHNAQTIEAIDDFSEVAYKFEKKFPDYTVTDGGKGLENRPKEFKGLSYIS